MSAPLSELQARYSAHPFWNNPWWEALSVGRFDASELTWMLEQNFLYVRSFGQLVAAVAANADDGVRALLSRELWQEGGSGDPTQRFAMRFRHLLREGLGVAHPDDGPFDEPARRWLRESLAGCKNEDPVFALAWLVYGHLAPMAKVRDALGDGLRKAHVDEKHLGLFKAASQSDSVKNLEQALASFADRPQWLETCSQAIDRSLDERDIYFGSQCSSLLRRTVREDRSGKPQ
jgi:hypothetical protein